MTTKTTYKNTKPPASKLVLLSELPRIPPGTKVRFLGCVTSYDAARATLILVDKHPATHSLLHAPKLGRTSRSATSRAVTSGSSQISLDVSIVLPPATPKELFRVGAWVCVLGYVAYSSPASTSGGRGSGQGSVQALMLYPAGAGTASGGLQDARYVRAVEARRKAMRGMEDARRRAGGLWGGNIGRMDEYGAAM